jgi:hypothetical protein
VIYNASVVNFYNATGSLARFENKNILFCFEKRSSLLQRWRCSCKFKNRRIGSWNCTYMIYLAFNDPYMRGWRQGNQIGRIFAHWVIVTEVAHIFGLLFSAVM